MGQLKDQASNPWTYGAPHGKAKPDKADKLKLTNYLTKQNLLGEFKFKKVTCIKEIPFSIIRNSFGLGSKPESGENTNSEL